MNTVILWVHKETTRVRCGATVIRHTVWVAVNNRNDTVIALVKLNGELNRSNTTVIVDVTDACFSCYSGQTSEVADYTAKTNVSHKDKTIGYTVYLEDA